VEGVVAVILFRLVGLVVEGELAMADAVGVAARNSIVDRVARVVSCAKDCVLILRELFVNVFKCY